MRGIGIVSIIVLGIGGCQMTGADLGNWCDLQESSPPSSTLTCEAAIPAAVDALPEDTGDVQGVEFHIGFWCQPGAYCPMIPPDENAGYIIFEVSGSARQEVVSVSMEPDGEVAATYQGSVDVTDLQ